MQVAQSIDRHEFFEKTKRDTEFRRNISIFLKLITEYRKQNLSFNIQYISLLILIFGLGMVKSQFNREYVVYSLFTIIYDQYVYVFCFPKSIILFSIKIIVCTMFKFGFLLSKGYTIVDI